MPGLEVPQVDGGRPAVHPEQDARPLPLRVPSGLGRERAQPPGDGRRGAGRPEAEEGAAVKIRNAEFGMRNGSHNSVPPVSLEDRVRAGDRNSAFRIPNWDQWLNKNS